jgi:hypothetical protein
LLMKSKKPIASRKRGGSLYQCELTAPSMTAAASRPFNLSLSAWYNRLPSQAQAAFSGAFQSRLASIFSGVVGLTS